MGDVQRWEWLSHCFMKRYQCRVQLVVNYYIICQLF